MFNIGAGEFIALLVLALILIGPDKLPHFAKDAAKFVQRVRGMAGRATEELRSNLGPGFEDLQVTDLRPKTLIQKHLNEALVDPNEFNFTEELKIDADDLGTDTNEAKKSPKIDPDLL
jgi:sec-independent protein translocase protein TatB